ncbi:MAG: hypothetical protein IPJ03_01000 [Ignavibacteriales bacterium]|nr:hypothetical protein [Ignavibacteriales bacterium]
MSLIKKKITVLRLLILIITINQHRSVIENKTGNIWNRIVEPKDEELDKIAERIRYLKNKKVDTYVNVNNHH